MTLYRAGLTALLVLIIVAVLHMASFYPALPDVVPSKFGVDGNVTRTMSKAGFITSYGVAVAVLGLMFSTITLVIARLPSSVINLPHKGFWLAPERRDDSLQFIATYLVWMGAATLAFVMAVMQ